MNPVSRSALQDHRRDRLPRIHRPGDRPDILRPRQGQLPLLLHLGLGIRHGKRAAGHADGLGGYPRTRPEAHAQCRDGVDAHLPSGRYTEDAATDATRLYNIELFRDEACSRAACQLAGRRKLASTRHLHRPGGFVPSCGSPCSGLRYPKRPTTPGLAQCQLRQLS